jgi:hypothetical protein
MTSFGPHEHLEQRVAESVEPRTALLLALAAGVRW